ncbi:MAG TPA: TonB-dependent receptor plug domain-containing protein, partial [Sphingomonas sp.]
MALLAGSKLCAADPVATASADVEAAERPGTEITVVGHNDKSTLARPVAAGILGSKSALDTPFTVSAVTADEIQNLQTKDINGVFQSDASITEINSSVAQASGASFRVRGVALDQLNSFKLDGLALPYWSIDLPIEQFDQIQLFKGATGFMYGFGSPAGVVNFVTRRPGDGLILNIDAGYRSDSLYSGHLDFSDRSADGRFGIRVNLQGESGTVYNGGYNYNYSGDIALEY